MLRFDRQAQEVWDAFRAVIEERVRGPESSDFPAFIAHIAKFRSLMPSLAVIDHLAEGGSHPDPFIGEQSALKAADTCEFLECHARKVYAEELRPEISAGYLLADKIRKGRVKDGDLVRDILRRGWAGLNPSRKLEDALETLEAGHWLRIVESESRPRGGRHERVIRLNPKFNDKG